MGRRVVTRRYSDWRLSDDELDLILDALYAYQSMERGRRARTAEKANLLRTRFLAGFVAAAWAAEAGDWVQPALPDST